MEGSRRRRRGSAAAARVAAACVGALVCAVSSASAQTPTPPPKSQASEIGEVVVTAERRPDLLRKVPIAVSALTAERLQAERIDGGQDLLLATPNVSYSRSNFSYFGGYDLQIRGIGTKVVSPSGDPGVSVNVDELPVVANHLGDTDFYDVQRVEVLRGPQGTLYGRDATGGAVDVITAKPTDRYEGALTADFGNYDSKKETGFVNLPLAPALALRLAGFRLDRDGFGVNSVTGDRIDDRHLGSFRATLAFRPNDRFSASLMVEHFTETDNRNRVGKQLCVTDPGPTSIGGVAVSPSAQGLLSQGCLPGSLYQSAAYGVLNNAASLGGILDNLIGLSSGNVYAGHPLQDSNLHDIQSAMDPVYRARETLLVARIDWAVSDSLSLSSITGLNRDTDLSEEDFNRVTPTTAFNATPAADNAIAQPFGPLSPAAYDQLYAQLFPGGVVSDPQDGVSDLFRSYDYEDDATLEFNEEIRLISSYAGRLNFSAGAAYGNDVSKSDYVVQTNGITAFAEVNNALGGALLPGLAYIDPNPTPTGAGHNYYDARFSDRVTSTAVFGETYYALRPDLKLTLGLRYTDDRKANVNFPIEFLCSALVPAPPPASGLVANPTCNPGPGFGSTTTLQAASFRALTGRVNLAWTPRVAFTDQTLVYASYSRGYQGGGFNTPCTSVTPCVSSSTFAPEYVDAFELGTKNTLDHGALTLDLTGFYYQETGYQISQIVAMSSVNSNIDARLYGLEFESAWSPTRPVTLNVSLGWLHTEVESGGVIDQFDLTQGDSGLTLVKAIDGSDCVVETAGLEALLKATGGAPGPILTTVCDGEVKAKFGTDFGLYDYGPGVTSGRVFVDGTNAGQNPGAPNYAQAIGVGVPVNLKGKQLPNAPDLTLSLGAQYARAVGGWDAVLRGDYYWQASSYARIFNSAADYLKGWDTMNLTLTFSRRTLKLQLYVKNLFDSQPITDSYLSDPSAGLFRNVFTTDPRTFGVALTQRF